MNRQARQSLTLLAVGAMLVGCAADRSASKSPSQPATPAASLEQPAPPGSPAPQATGDEKRDATFAPPPPKPADSKPSEPGKTPGTSSGGGTESRSAALRGAARDLEASQRELDVAAGDCRNACRALGSMDRAAGHLCDLAQIPEEVRRCDDAKQKLYSARDRVKTTCGSCPGGASVDRNAPVPSLR